ncbi:MAG: MoaD/ThiS family protein [Bacteroidia bacterium]|nr:MoaD/ThiS family protein [Bacteroidia bacterium]
MTTKLKILAFGIARDIMGGSSVQFNIEMPTTTSKLKKALIDQFPEFIDVRSLAVAVNNEYSSGSDVILDGDEVAIIPPVSGG